MFYKAAESHTRLFYTQSYHIDYEKGHSKLFLIISDERDTLLEIKNSLDTSSPKVIMNDVKKFPNKTNQSSENKENCKNSNLCRMETLPPNAKVLRLECANSTNITGM